ncbi:MAG: isoprenylcysteine carboxylmethyltransferase family protein [Bacteroidetes bacterium]|nr:MAG: isoprenylcysteine carboxylmethyltransferase family protein [Bacteroidota bacterium]
MMEAIKKDNPKIYLPPPLIYVAIFLISLFIQKLFPLDRSFFFSDIAANLGMVFIICSVAFAIPALIQFVRTKNAFIPIKPASSLQTKGIYSITRNPMYMGLLLLYCGIAITKGNWWSLILIPLLIVIVQYFIIKREEAYLEREFGDDYSDYKKRVRRWI